MVSNDFYVMCLIRLCDLEGGHEVVAEKSGVSAANLWQILNGIKLPSGSPRGMGVRLKEKISAAYPDWDKQPSPARTTQKVSDDIEINHFATGGSMGGGLVLRDQPGVIQSWRVSPEWIAKNVKTYSAAKNLCIVTGFGDSMRPLYNPGDPLLVDTGVNTVDFEGVYFFRVGDEGYVKRLQRIPGQGLLVISDNTKYRDWTIAKGMDFQVFGRVIKVWSGEEL